MSRFTDKVTDFHKVFGSKYIGETPAVRDEYNRAKLILEEAMEFVAACGLDPIDLADRINSEKRITHNVWGAYIEQKKDLVEAVDALADLYYVTAGAFVAFGVKDDPVFDEVHRSNMTKFLNGKANFDEVGKVLKPKEWSPPDIAGELKKQGWRE